MPTDQAKAVQCMACTHGGVLKRFYVIYKSINKWKATVNSNLTVAGKGRTQGIEILVDSKLH